MKMFKIFPKIALLFAAITITSDSAWAQKKKNEDKKAEIKKMVMAQNYDFKAQTMFPLRGPTRQLISDYDLSVSKDKVVSFLPYFGRAFVAPMDPSKGGLQFTSKDFVYTIHDRKKGGWNITIKPKDIQEIQQMSLTIFENGNASLQVTSTQRDPISFNGYITGQKEKK